MSYQRFFEWIENFTKLWPVLCIASVPHFTTLQKFTARCPKPYLDHFILISGLNGNKNHRTASIDSTGYSITNASFYYTVVIKTRQKTKSGRPRSRRLIKKYLKVTFLIDVNDQTIASIGMVLADKGYDSEANHEYVHDVFGADTIIPACQSKYDDFKTRGKYRKMMKAGYDKAIYRKRNMSETINSVLKRRMGDCVKAKNVLNQNREIIFMVMTYNTEKSLFLYILFIGFLESQTL